MACYFYRKRGKLYILGLSIFGLYLLIGIAQVFFPIPLAENWPANITWENTYQRLTRINLIPFNYGTMFLFQINPKIIFWEIAGNILLTVPFGIGICFLSKIPGIHLFWLALTVGLAIEAVQLFIGLVVGSYYHSVDINDVILNAFGALVGIGLYRVVYWIVHSLRMRVLKTG